MFPQRPGNNLSPLQRLTKMAGVVWTLAVLATVVGGALGTCPKKSSTELRVLTYNLGLAPEVAQYEKRRLDLVDLMLDIKNNYDFMCLQEVWFKKDMVEIIDALSSALPHHYSVIHTAPDQLPVKKGPAPCTNATAVENCQSERCPNMEWHGENVCMLQQCHEQIYKLNADCRACGMVSTRNLEVCDKPENRFNAPGLLVLSKRNITQADYVSLHDQANVIVQKGYIKVNLLGLPNNLTIACTRLATDFSYFFDVKLKDKYNSSYEAMYRAEITQVHDNLKSGPHILMGNLNTGPAVASHSVQAEMGSNYNYLNNDLGYRNPYIEQIGECTYCKNNALAHTFFFENDVIVDHVLLSKDLAYDSATYNRTFVGSQHLSDHYGVNTNLCLS